MKATLRTLLIPAIAAAAVVGLAGCSGSTTDASTSSESAPLYSSLPKAIQDAGEINVAMNVDYAPFESFEDDGTTITGIDKDLGDLLEKQLGVTMKYTNISFDAVVPGMAAGRYDVALSAITDTKEREATVDFVDYFAGGGAVLYPTKTTHTITNDLSSLCGLKVAVVQGGAGIPDVKAASKACTEAGKSAIDYTTYPGQGQQLLAVRSGRADATLIDAVTGGVAAKASNGLYSTTKPYSTAIVGMAFNKKDTDLRGVFVKAFEAIKADGSYEKVLKKYGVEANALDEFTINGATS